MNKRKTKLSTAAKPSAKNTSINDAWYRIGATDEDKRSFVPLPIVAFPSDQWGDEDVVVVEGKR